MIYYDAIIISFD